MIQVKFEDGDWQRMIQAKVEETDKGCISKWRRELVKRQVRGSERFVENLSQFRL